MEYGIYKFGDLTFEIEYIYDDGEAGVMYYSDMSGLPETSASIEIHNIFLDSTEVSEILTENFRDTIEVHLLNSHR